MEDQARTGLQGAGEGRESWASWTCRPHGFPGLLILAESSTGNCFKEEAGKEVKAPSRQVSQETSAVPCQETLGCHKQGGRSGHLVKFRHPMQHIQGVLSPTGQQVRCLCGVTPHPTQR